jgi:hypothetical protein
VWCGFVELVKITESEKTLAWIHKYPTAIKHMPLDNKKQAEYEQLLNKFCYSLTTLQPICDAPIWRKSKAVMPELSVLPAR